MATKVKWLENFDKEELETLNEKITGSVKEWMKNWIENYNTIIVINGRATTRTKPLNLLIDLCDWNNVDKMEIYNTIAENESIIDLVNKKL